MRQSVLALAAVMFEYVPTGQSLQALSSAVLNFPATHVVQLDWPVLDVKPGAQWLHAERPAGLKDPAEQVWHTPLEDAPLLVLNVPATQSTHALIPIEL